MSLWDENLDFISFHHRKTIAEKSSRKSENANDLSPSSKRAVGSFTLVLIISWYKRAIVHSTPRDSDSVSIDLGRGLHLTTWLGARIVLERHAGIVVANRLKMLVIGLIV